MYKAHHAPGFKAAQVLLEVATTHGSCTLSSSNIDSVTNFQLVSFDISEKTHTLWSSHLKIRLDHNMTPKMFPIKPKKTIFQFFFRHLTFHQDPKPIGNIIYPKCKVITSSSETELRERRNIEILRITCSYEWIPSVRSSLCGNYSPGYHSARTCLKSEESAQLIFSIQRGLGIRFRCSDTKVDSCCQTSMHVFAYLRCIQEWMKNDVFYLGCGLWVVGASMLSGFHLTRSFVGYFHLPSTPNATDAFLQLKRADNSQPLSQYARHRHFEVNTIAGLENRFKTD